MRTRIQSLSDERGFALILAISLVTLVTLTAVSIMTLTQGEDTNSRRDQAKDGAFQAAEAGTNAYLSDLTQSNIFFSGYMAKGEATRTDGSNVAHANNCSVTCSDLAWTSGTTWTYKTAAASDTGWFNLGNGYDYLIKVYPPNTSLLGLAQVITRIDVIGRPHGGIDVTKWHTIETMIRPSSLTDFQAFLGSSISYGSAATTSGPIFVGEDSNGVKGTLNHDGTAKANLYAEGSVTGSTTLLNAAKKYDKSTSPTALCKLNNCAAVPFSSLTPTIPKVKAAAGAPGNILLAATDPTNPALSGQSPAYSVDAWKLVFQTNGTVLVSSCKKYSTGGSTPTIYEDYDGTNQPVCGTAVSKTVPPLQGAIYSDGPDVIVSGVVNGTLAVATPGDIVYGGNLTYTQNGADVIGLEAGGTIYIARWAPDANGDITIYGAQFALGGPWTADPKSPCGSGSPQTNGCHAVCSTITKCTMNFYGSSALEGVSGGSISMSAMFNTRNYNYDPNLLFLPPPFWPSLGNSFTILVQREL
ncbi:MAG TPA: pilus assembly PilX N-terminal domain-containing protein [Gaiellaceae bacterium]|nr:pilus assembly PilX N-terminal domain-containing protein [Gaiellaceae bacterium]